jgi:hypothetical protein
VAQSYDYPTDFKENIIYRDYIRQLAENDVDVQREELEKVDNDPLYCFNTYFWTYDPRVTPAHLPFLTYDFQNEFILRLAECIRNGEDLLVDKSRDMGVSWIVVSTFFYFWIQRRPGFNTLLGSRKEDLVDKKGNLDTLLEKARYQLYKLPLWMLPDGFNPSSHDIHMQLYNPQTGNTIQGESTNEHFATGGRYKAVLFDEAAKWGALAEAAWVSAGDSTPCRVAVSTPFGMGTHFARLRHSKTTPTMTFHWTKHPVKAKDAYCLIEDKSVRSPWYDRECERRAATPIAIAQELDIDYVASGSPAFSMDYVKKLQRMTEAYLMDKKPRRVNINGGVITPTETGRIHIFNLPNPECQYVIGADSAEGVALGDYSAGIVLNRNTMSIDAMYQARTSPDHFAYDIMTLGYLYSGRDKNEGALLAIENNSIGMATVLKADEEDYPNLYYHVNEHLATKTPTKQMGWKTTRTTKKILIGEIESYLYNAQSFAYFVPQEVLEELTTFVIKGTKGEMLKYEADSGCNDDLVMALGIALVAHQSSDLIPKRVVKQVGRQGFEVVKEPTIHERILQQLKEESMQHLMDEHMGGY